MTAIGCLYLFGFGVVSLIAHCFITDRYYNMIQQDKIGTLSRRLKSNRIDKVYSFSKICTNIFFLLFAIYAIEYLFFTK